MNVKNFVNVNKLCIYIQTVLICYIIEEGSTLYGFKIPFGSKVFLMWHIYSIISLDFELCR